MERRRTASGRSRRARATRAGLVAAVASLVLAGSAVAAFGPLPADGRQVNDDPAASIDPAQDAGVADVAGGTVVPGNLQVPWATFEQRTGSAQQIFVRAFKGGQWVTQGFPATLNIDASKEAEEPSIDFAGAGRATPWVSWYEPNDNLPGGETNIFASRFNAAANHWLPSGQDRAAPSQVPSLNINTDREAENPAVVGGAAVAGNDPVPWVAWQEQDGSNRPDDQRTQIFVSRAVKQAANGTPCAGFAPGAGANVNGFCWQQVGNARVSRTSLGAVGATDPSLDIDPTRNGVEPDDAFTGPGDTVPWVVWYEEDPSGIPGLPGNQMVFAAKAVADATVSGGFKWVAVGNGTAGQVNVLDTTGAHGAGHCLESATTVRACSLNRDSTASAQEPRVAAGTLTPGGTTVPWVVWDEVVGGGQHAIFVSRLVGDHFELFNNGQPISNTVNDSTHPDITFSGNVPYISWIEQVGSQRRSFYGHFEGGATSPVFRLDTPEGVAQSAAGSLDQRSPISSSCTATPFDADGASCQGGAVGTPFFLHADGATDSQKLFAKAYEPTGAQTGAASGVTASSALVSGSVNPGGAPLRVHFEFGATTAYGTSTAAQALPAGISPVGVSAAIASLPASTTIHYRLVAQSDFATFAGADATLTTAAAPPAPPVTAPPVTTPPVTTPPTIPNVAPKLSFKGLAASVALHRLGLTHRLVLHLTVSERSTVTVQLLHGQKQVRRLVLTRTRGGSFVARLSLLRVPTGRYTLKISARDPQGAVRSVSRSLRVTR